MELRKIAVKFFAEDPGAVRLEEFIPVLHRWIQERRVEGTLIDVADYSHLPNGPGVVLIGHVADWFIDGSEGPLGLLYHRKREGDGIEPAFRAALDACDKLEEEPELKGRLKFRRGEALFLVNDRLEASNTDETFAAVKPELVSALEKVFPGKTPALRRANEDPRDRFGIHATGL